MTEYGVFEDGACIEAGFHGASGKAAAEERAARLVAAHPEMVDAYEVLEMCPDHEEQPKNGCEECATDGDDESEEPEDEEEPEFKPVGFNDVREGDRVQFVTANNGFGGGDDVWRTGTVVKVTDKTVTVEITGHNPLAENVFVGGKSRKLGRTASLRRAEWQRRCVSKAVAEQPARRPYSAENVRIVDGGAVVSAVWVSDPTVDPAVALENILRRDLPYEVEVVAEATRSYKRDGADFSGWVVASRNNYSDPIPNRRDAMRELRFSIRDYFAR
jgi:hypothetical protein